MSSLSGDLAVGTKVLSAVWGGLCGVQRGVARQWATWICPSPKPPYLDMEIGSFARIRIWVVSPSSLVCCRLEVQTQPCSVKEGGEAGRVHMLRQAETGRFHRMMVKKTSSQPAVVTAPQREQARLGPQQVWWNRRFLSFSTARLMTICYSSLRKLLKLRQSRDELGRR